MKRIRNLVFVSAGITIVFALILAYSYGNAYAAGEGINLIVASSETSVQLTAGEANTGTIYAMNLQGSPHDFWLMVPNGVSISNCQHSVLTGQSWTVDTISCSDLLGGMYRLDTSGMHMIDFDYVVETTPPQGSRFIVLAQPVDQTENFKFYDDQVWVNPYMLSLPMIRH